MATRPGRYAERGVSGHEDGPYGWYALVENELMRVGVHNPTEEVAVRVDADAQELYSDPEFQPIDRERTWMGSSYEEERYLWAAMRAAHTYASMGSEEELRRIERQQLGAEFVEGPFDDELGETKED